MGTHKYEYNLYVYTHNHFTTVLCVYSTKEEQYYRIYKKKIIKLKTSVHEVEILKRTHTKK